MTGWVLCGVDGSPHARGIVLVAARFASALGLRLMAVHVAEGQPSLPDTHRPPAARRQHPPASAMRLLESATSQPWIRWDTVRRVGFGDPADELLRLVHEHDVRLLVVGSRGAGRRAAAYLGRVARRLAGESPRPVLVVPPRAAHAADVFEPGQGAAAIVCALDGSGESDLAFRYAAEIGWLCGARLVLAHVGEPHGGGGTAAPRAEAEFAVLRDVGRTVGGGSLEAAAEALADGPPLELPLQLGDTPTEIDRVAARRRAELIVVGARGPRCAPSARLGPLSAGLAASASRPVLIVPQAAAGSSLARCCPWLEPTSRPDSTGRAFRRDFIGSELHTSTPGQPQRSG